jgi:hypothetical protein
MYEACLSYMTTIIINISSIIICLLSTLKNSDSKWGTPLASAHHADPCRHDALLLLTIDIVIRRDSEIGWLAGVAGVEWG